jgi:hypothetical protein
MTWVAAFIHMHSPGTEHGNATGKIIAGAVEQLLEAAPRDRRLFEETHRPYAIGARAPPAREAR